MNNYEIEKVMKLNAEQLETVVDKIVPLIASEEDYGFFEGVIRISLDACKSSAEQALLVQKLLGGTS